MDFFNSTFMMQTITLHFFQVLLIGFRLQKLATNVSLTFKNVSGSCNLLHHLILTMPFFYE